jgi:hypothetical protein
MRASSAFALLARSFTKAYLLRSRGVVLEPALKVWVSEGKHAPAAEAEFVVGLNVRAEARTYRLCNDERKNVTTTTKKACDEKRFSLLIRLARVIIHYVPERK